MSQPDAYFHEVAEWDEESDRYRHFLVCPLPICQQRFAEPEAGPDAEVTARLAAHLQTHSVVDALEQLRLERMEFRRSKDQLRRELLRLEYLL